MTLSQECTARNASSKKEAWLKPQSQVAGLACDKQFEALRGESDLIPLSPLSFNGLKSIS